MDQQLNHDELLRSRAVEVDTTASGQLDLGTIWRELVSGESRVKDSFHSAERCYLVIESPHALRGPARRAGPGKVRILESILLEGAQKNVAIDWGLSPSTVAGALKQCLEQLGVPCTTSRISPLLVSAAYASRAGASPRWGRCSELSDFGKSYRVVSVPRPESQLAPLLTRAQYEVIQLLMEGKSHDEIARARKRSTRTIANQLGAAFRKLGVSGRTELIRRLVLPAAEAGTALLVRSPGLRGAGDGALLRQREPLLNVRRYRSRTRRNDVPASP